MQAKFLLRLVKILLLFALGLGFQTQNLNASETSQTILINSPYYRGPQNVLANYAVSMENNYDYTLIGSGTCPAEHDKPGISKKKHHNHMDEDCCPDFDEWPNPGCWYSANGYDAMLPGPTSGHEKHKHK